MSRRRKKQQEKKQQELDEKKRKDELAREAVLKKLDELLDEQKLITDELTRTSSESDDGPESSIVSRIKAAKNELKDIETEYQTTTAKKDFQALKDFEKKRIQALEQNQELGDFILGDEFASSMEKRFRRLESDAEELLNLDVDVLSAQSLERQLSKTRNTIRSIQEWDAFLRESGNLLSVSPEFTENLTKHLSSIQSEYYDDLREKVLPLLTTRSVLSDAFNDGRLFRGEGELFAMDSEGRRIEYPDSDALKEAARKKAGQMYQRPVPIARMTQSMVDDVMSVLDKGVPVSANHFNLGLGAAVEPYLPKDNLTEKERERLEEACDTEGLEKRLSNIMLGFREDEYGYISKNLNGDSKTGYNALANASKNMVSAIEDLMLENSMLLRTMHSPDAEERKWATRRMMQIMENALKDYERRANDIIDRLDPEVLRKKAEGWQAFHREMEQNWQSNKRTLTDPQNMFAQFVLLNFCPGFGIALMAPLLMPVILSLVGEWKEKKYAGAAKLEASLYAEEKSEVGAARILGTIMGTELIPYLATETSPAELARMIEDSRDKNQEFLQRIRPELMKLHSEFTKEGSTLEIAPNSPEAAAMKRGMEQIAKECLMQFHDAKKITNDKGEEIFVMGNDHLATMSLVGDVANATKGADFLSFQTKEVDGKNIVVLETKKDEHGTLDFKSGKGLGQKFVDRVAVDAERYARNINSMTSEMIDAVRTYHSAMINGETLNTCASSLYSSSIGARTEMVHREEYGDEDSTFDSWPKNAAEMRKKLEERRYVQYSLSENATKTLLGVGRLVDVKPATIRASLDAMYALKNEVAALEEKLEEKEKPTRSEISECAKKKEVCASAYQAFLADMSMRIVPQKAWAAMSEKDEAFIEAAERVERSLAMIPTEENNPNDDNKIKHLKEREEYVKAAMKKHEAEKHMLMASVTASQLREEIKLREKGGYASQNISERLMRASLAYHLKESFELSREAENVFGTLETAKENGHVSLYTKSLDSMLEEYGIQETKEERSAFAMLAAASEAAKSDIVELLNKDCAEPLDLSDPELFERQIFDVLGKESKEAMDGLENLVNVAKIMPNSDTFKRELNSFVQLGNAVATEEAIKNLLKTAVGDVSDEASKRRDLFKGNSTWWDDVKSVVLPEKKKKERVVEPDTGVGFGPSL